MALNITVHTPNAQTSNRCAACAGGSHRAHHFQGATWHVPSGDGSKMYSVILHEGHASCNCPNGQHTRQGAEPKCHHVRTARFEASKLTASRYDLFDGDELPAPKPARKPLSLEDLFVA